MKQDIAQKVIEEDKRHGTILFSIQKVVQSWLMSFSLICFANSLTSTLSPYFFLYLVRSGLAGPYCPLRFCVSCHPMPFRRKPVRWPVMSIQLNSSTAAKHSLNKKLSIPFTSSQVERYCWKGMTAMMMIIIITGLQQRYNIKTEDSLYKEKSIPWKKLNYNKSISSNPMQPNSNIIASHTLILYCVLTYSAFSSIQLNSTQPKTSSLPIPSTQLNSKTRENVLLLGYAQVSLTCTHFPFSNPFKFFRAGLTEWSNPKWEIWGPQGSARILLCFLCNLWRKKNRGCGCRNQEKNFFGHNLQTDGMLLYIHTITCQKNVE